MAASHQPPSCHGGRPSATVATIGTQSQKSSYPPYRNPQAHTSPPNPHSHPISCSVTASRSAPPPSTLPQHQVPTIGDPDAPLLPLSSTPADSSTLRPPYKRLTKSPAPSQRPRRSSNSRPLTQPPCSDSWFHFIVEIRLVESVAAIAHEPANPPSQAPSFTASHRSGINRSSVFMEDYQWQACEQARRNARSHGFSRQSTPTQGPSYTPSNVDTAPTPASDFSLVNTPLSPSLKSDRADDAVQPQQQQHQIAAKKSTLPAWSQPRSWSGLVSKDSNATSFTMPQIGEFTSTSASTSVAPSDTGSPTVASPRANGPSALSAPPAKAWQPKQRLSLEAILADSHTNFVAPLTVPRGLINKGNFCFANAILQVLVFCAPFYNLFNTLGKELAADLANTTPLIEAVVQFLREFHLAARTRNAREGASGDSDLVTNPQLSEPFVPEFVYEAMRLNKRFDLMRRGHQEDAEEFLGFFLDTLHEELLAAMQRSAARIAASTKSIASGAVNGVGGGAQGGGDSTTRASAASDETGEEREVARPVSPTEEGWMEVGQKGKTAFTRTTSTSESPITRIFGGKLRSVLRTPGAKDSVTLEPYQPLQLDIQPHSVQTIEDALLNLTVPETIPGVFSPARNGPVDATKQVFIERTPPVLILHLKRFFYDEVGGVQKNVKEVGYSDTLEVGGDMVSPTKRLEGPVKYRLFGVVYHHGRYATGGHYTVDVLRQDGSSWVHFDDTMFNAVAAEHVGRKANPHGSGSMVNGSGPGHDGLAYLLFYKRIDGVDVQAGPSASASASTAAGPMSPVPSSRSKSHARANGQASGLHTRESSASGTATGGNRFATVQSSEVPSPSKGGGGSSSKAAAGAAASPGRKQREREASSSQNNSNTKKGGPKTTEPEPVQPPRPRVVPGAAPGKVKKVKT